MYHIYYEDGFEYKVILSRIRLDGKTMIEKYTLYVSSLYLSRLFPNPQSLPSQWHLYNTISSSSNLMLYSLAFTCSALNSHAPTALSHSIAKTADLWTSTPHLAVSRNSSRSAQVSIGTNDSSELSRRRLRMERLSNITFSSTCLLLRAVRPACCPMGM